VRREGFWSVSSSLASWKLRNFFALKYAILSDRSSESIDWSVIDQSVERSACVA
jgi:hypothetical protein